MRRKKKLGINAILNVIKSSLAIIFPLITYPYAIRAIGVDNMGKVSFSQSVISYFSMLAMLGVSTYGVREGARRKENLADLSNFASELFTVNLISAIFSYILLFISIVIFGELRSYSNVLMIQSISIIFTVFGVDWINSVFEDYLLITVRSIFIYLATALTLFAFVKGPDDYLIYAALTVISHAIVCFSNMVYVRKYVRISLVKDVLRLVSHIKPLLVLFANNIAVLIYVNVDITMLGVFKNDYEVGLYSSAVKIYTIVKNLLAAIYVVTIPRLSGYYGKTDLENYKKDFTKITCALSMFLIPASIGIISVSEDLMLVIGGSLDFLQASPTLKILAVGLIFTIFGGLNTAVLNVTTNREKINLRATIISAILNFTLNFLCIPFLGMYGAALTTLISELFVFGYCFVSFPDKAKYMNIKKIVKAIRNAFIASIGIVIVCFFTRYLNFLPIVELVVSAIFSVGVYAIVLLLLRDEFAKKTLDLICKKIKSQ